MADMAVPALGNVECWMFMGRSCTPVNHRNVLSFDHEFQEGLKFRVYSPP